MKKLGFFLILSILLISCTSLDSVQKTNKSHREIDEKIRIWDLENAEEMIMSLSDAEKETYINIINESKEKLGKLYELENIETMVVGAGLNTNLPENLEGFQKKYKINNLKSCISNI